MPIYEWGVDSAENVTEDLFQCVVRNFGYPRFWGRYLLRVAGISEGLTVQEIQLIQSKRIKLLPIYNSFREALSYRQGGEAAVQAVFHAQKLGIPPGVPLFANVERFFQIDAEWIQGWTETIVSIGYKSGIYNDPVTGNFSSAFCNAAKENVNIKTFNILWSAQPELETSGSHNAPLYHPTVPECGGNVWIWQYGRQAVQCPIDTNLAAGWLINELW